jgi:cystathionine beta-lyase/cystathionine gamma-synthase
MEPTPPRPKGGFATRAVHSAVAQPDVQQRPMAPSIHPATAWTADRNADLAEILADERPGYAYGRLDNPTNTTLHGAIANLHGSASAWSLATGTAAIHAALGAVRGNGRILATSRLYGGTVAILGRLAVESRWPIDYVDMTVPGALDAAITSEHTVLYAETIANPTTAVTDLAAVAAAARRVGATSVVDNTFASPAVCRPIELGIDVVVESATKFIGGHGDVLAGVVASNADVIAKVRSFTFEYGAALGPFEAWLVLRGIQTLPLRLREQCRNAMGVAAHLQSRGVPVVHHPSLASHPQHDLATKQFVDGHYGAMLAFELPDRARAESFADAVEVFARVTSLGATHSLLLHPASTSHRQLDEAGLAAAGITSGTIRMSIGIEDLDDLLVDVDRALFAAGILS